MPRKLQRLGYGKPGRPPKPGGKSSNATSRVVAIRLAHEDWDELYQRSKNEGTSSLGEYLRIKLTKLARSKRKNL